MRLRTKSASKRNELLSKRFEFRLSDSDYQQIQALAEQVNLDMSEFVRRVATRRAIPCPLTAFDLKAYQVLCEIHSELRQAGNNLNQIAKACNTSVMLGEPVVVNRSLLENTEQLLKENQTLIQTIASAIAKSTVV